MHGGLTTGRGETGCAAEPLYRSKSLQRVHRTFSRTRSRNQSRIAANDQHAGAETAQQDPLPLQAASSTRYSTQEVDAIELEASELAAAVAAPPPGAALLPAKPLQPGQPPPLTTGASWVWACALLLAARLGRAGAEEARLDVRQLQSARQRRRALSKELLAARERWRAAEGARALAEDAKRVEEAAARAQEEARRRVEEQRCGCRGWPRADAAAAAAHPPPAPSTTIPTLTPITAHTHNHARTHTHTHAHTCTCTHLCPPQQVCRGGGQGGGPAAGGAGGGAAGVRGGAGAAGRGVQGPRGAGARAFLLFKV